MRLHSELTLARYRTLADTPSPSCVRVLCSQRRLAAESHTATRTLGIAYVGTVCTPYGVLVLFDCQGPLAAGTLAHEILHVMGVHHGHGVMAAINSGAPDVAPATSLNVTCLPITDDMGSTLAHSTPPWLPVLLLLSAVYTLGSICTWLYT